MDFYEEDEAPEAVAKMWREFREKGPDGFTNGPRRLGQSWSGSRNKTFYIHWPDDV